jgi:hypothetical protein
MEEENTEVFPLPRFPEAFKTGVSESHTHTRKRTTVGNCCHEIGWKITLFASQSHSDLE